MDDQPERPVGSEHGLRAWLYDVDGEDAPVRVERFQLADLRNDQLLWVDVDLEAVRDLQALWSDLKIEGEVSLPVKNQPAFIRHRGFVQVNVMAVRTADSAFEPLVMYCFVGRNWIATLHHGEFDLVERFNEPLSGDTRLGELDAPAFLSLVLDAILNGYFRVIERVQGEIDELDEELLHPMPNRPALLDRLYQTRRRVTTIRTTLEPHRDVFGMLSHPKSEAVLGSRAATDYRRLSDRLETALAALSTAREMIVGSFDIFMTQTAQTTNEIMKRLTLASVLLLPAVVIAGIMGMNFKVGIFEWPWMFWVTLVLMAFLAVATMIVARRRHWL